MIKRNEIRFLGLKLAFAEHQFGEHVMEQPLRRRDRGMFCGISLDIGLAHLILCDGIQDKNMREDFTGRAISYYQRALLKIEPFRLQIAMGESDLTDRLHENKINSIYEGISDIHEKIADCYSRLNFYEKVVFRNELAIVNATLMTTIGERRTNFLFQVFFKM